MKTLLVDIESTANLQVFMDVVKNLDFVKSVKLNDDPADKPNSSVVNEPAGEYNWTNPVRPATDAEVEQLVVKMENSTGGYSTKEVKEKMKEWAAQKSK